MAVERYKGAYKIHTIFNTLFFVPSLMSLIAILIILIVIGGIVYLIKIAPIDQLWKNIAYGVLAVFVIVWLLLQLRGAGFDLKI